MKCPTCRRPVEWSRDSAYRPFCSDRCRLIDLGAWLTEQHRIPDESGAERVRRRSRRFDRGTLSLAAGVLAQALAAGQIGFHQAAVDRHLLQFWPDLGLADVSRVFVPLCGKSLDLLWLREHSHAVIGVELSAIALESFCLEQGVPARRRPLDRFDVYEATKLQLYRGDFFALSAQVLGHVSAVYDRAALISWAPELRAAYASHIMTLTRRGTQTLLITTEYPQDQMAGPPFSVGAVEVDRLYGKDHDIRQLSKVDILAHEPRLRSAGSRNCMPPATG